MTMMGCAVRRALRSDASAACEVVRRSIVELCYDDHGGDESTLTEWLANKTPANFEEWIASERHAAFVAERDRVIIGFGLLDLQGTIALLYVSPDARFSGVSKALLAALEREAIAAGIGVLKLESSITALRFYTRAGYSSTGCSAKGFGITNCQPMSRQLTAAVNEAGGVVPRA
jgi:GNAT superfamily N-acetyltransferase